MNRAKQLRMDLGVTAKHVCEQARISRNTLRKLEAGNEIEAPSLARISTYYGVTASELLAPARFPEGEAA
jgi:transcriptional regulator with XRE-family HTH domain